MILLPHKANLFSNGYCYVNIIAFAISSLFAVFSMAGASVMRYEMPIWELIVLYFPPTFFLSSLCALLGIICRQDHIATLVCGVIWLIILLTRSLLRFPGLEYVYLFIRFAGDQNNIWLWNKRIITLQVYFYGVLFTGNAKGLIEV